VGISVLLCRCNCCCYNCTNASKSYLFVRNFWPKIQKSAQTTTTTTTSTVTSFQIQATGSSPLLPGLGYAYVTGGFLEDDTEVQVIGIGPAAGATDFTLSGGQLDFQGLLSVQDPDGEPEIFFAMSGYDAVLFFIDPITLVITAENTVNGNSVLQYFVLPPLYLNPVSGAPSDISLEAVPL